MHILSATKTATEIVYTVWLDTTKTTATGAPDPDWVVTYRYLAAPPPIPATILQSVPIPEAQWEAWVAQQVTVQAQAALAAKQATPSPLVVASAPR